MITLEAYAKINLTLEVLSKRSDDYHEIRSVMQTISLCDRLSFENFPHLCFQCMSSGWVAEESVVSKAARLLMQRTGIPRGAKVKIDKCIPLSSGLGGDSSDAVVVLRGLNQLWETGVPASDLVSLAAALGSDLPFFFSGGTALVQGRGDLVSSLPEMSQCWLVLLFPDVARLTSKTAVLYSMLCPEDFTQGTHTDAFLMRLTQGASITSEDLFNVFEKVAMKAF
jgi:4-diphosphocytidyl-2-C-methyl-D-erythritol kinase